MVVLDPAGRDLPGTVERHAEVRITVIGDPDREEGEVPVELGDGLAQLAGRGVLAQAVAWA